MKSCKCHVNDDSDGCMEDGARRERRWRDDGSREIFWKLLNGLSGKMSKGNDVAHRKDETYVRER